MSNESNASKQFLVMEVGEKYELYDGRFGGLVFDEYDEAESYIKCMIKEHEWIRFTIMPFYGGS